MSDCSKAENGPAYGLRHVVMEFDVRPIQGPSTLDRYYRIQSMEGMDILHLDNRHAIQCLP